MTDYSEYLNINFPKKGNIKQRRTKMAKEKMGNGNKTIPKTTKPGGKSKGMGKGKGKGGAKQAC